MKNKKCATGVKKMSFSKYEDGTKRVRSTDEIQDHMDFYRKAKNSKEYNFKPADKKYIQSKIAQDSTELVAKGIKVSKPAAKYADGTSGIFSKLKKKQNESDAAAEAIDAEDTSSSSTSSSAATPKKMNFFGKLKAKQKKNDFNAEVTDNFDKELKNAKPSSENPELAPINSVKSIEKIESPSTKPNIPTTVSKIATKSNNGIQMEQVREYQKRHGLKVDGIWGGKDSETNKFYESQQAAKKMKFSSPTKTVTATKTTDSSGYPGGRKALNESTRKNDLDLAASQATTFKAPKNIGEGFKTVKGKSYSKPGLNSEDSARRAEYMYPDPEMHGSKVNDAKTAQKLVDIDKKGEETSYSTAAKLGIPAAVVAAGLGVAAYKNRGKIKASISRGLGKAVTKGLMEGAEDIKPKVIRNPSAGGRNLGNTRVGGLASTAEREAALASNKTANTVLPETQTAKPYTTSEGIKVKPKKGATTVVENKYRGDVTGELEKVKANAKAKVEANRAANKKDIPYDSNQPGGVKYRQNKIDDEVQKITGTKAYEKMKFKKAESKIAQAKNVIENKSIPSKKEVNKNIAEISNNNSASTKSNTTKNVDEAMQKALEYKKNKKKMKFAFDTEGNYLGKK